VSLGVKGMKPSSLPVPLSHLQGISLDSDDGLTALLKHITQLAGLDFPVAYAVSAGVANILASWKTGATAKENDELITWMLRSERRPKRHVGSSASGFFRAKNITATDPIETKQLPDYGLLSGDSVRCWVDVEVKRKPECIALRLIVSQTSSTNCQKIRSFMERWFAQDRLKFTVCHHGIRTTIAGLIIILCG
jgi:hypothetical protein